MVYNWSWFEKTKEKQGEELKWSTMGTRSKVILQGAWNYKVSSVQNLFFLLHFLFYFFRFAKARARTMRSPTTCHHFFSLLELQRWKPWRQGVRLLIVDFLCHCLWFQSHNDDMLNSLSSWILFPNLLEPWQQRAISSLFSWLLFSKLVEQRAIITRS